MLPYSVIAATQRALRDRTDWMEQGQTLLLAVRITPTTVDPVTGLAAQRCPDCWDPTLHQVTVPNDTTCLGVGWIIAASGSVAQQGGYLSAVPLDDAFVNANENRTTWTAQGVVSYSADMLYWEPQASIVPKKGDVVLQSGPTLARTRRYVVGDQDDPRTLGGSVLYETAILESHHYGSIIYRIPPADTGNLTPGTWG